MNSSGIKPGTRSPLYKCAIPGEAVVVGAADDFRKHTPGRTKLMLAVYNYGERRMTLLASIMGNEDGSHSCLDQLSPDVRHRRPGRDFAECACA